MGVPLLARVKAHGKLGCDPVWRPFNAAFAVGNALFAKDAVLQSVCAKSSRFLDQPFYEGESAATNMGVLHEVPGHRIPVAAFDKHPCVRALHARLGACSAKVRPQTWRPAWTRDAFEPSRALLQESSRSGILATISPTAWTGWP